MPDNVVENLSDRKKLRGKKIKSEILRKRLNFTLTPGSDEERILKKIFVILMDFLLSYLRH